MSDWRCDGCKDPCFASIKGPHGGKPKLCLIYHGEVNWQPNEPVKKGCDNCGDASCTVKDSPDMLGGPCNHWRQKPNKHMRPAPKFKVGDVVYGVFRTHLSVFKGEIHMFDFDKQEVLVKVNSFPIIINHVHWSNIFSTPEEAFAALERK